MRTKATIKFTSHIKDNSKISIFSFFIIEHAKTNTIDPVIYK